MKNTEFKSYEIKPGSMTFTPNEDGTYRVHVQRYITNGENVCRADFTIGRAKVGWENVAGSLPAIPVIKEVLPDEENSLFEMTIPDDKE